MSGRGRTVRTVAVVILVGLLALAPTAASSAESQTVHGHVTAGPAWVVTSNAYWTYEMVDVTVWWLFHKRSGMSIFYGCGSAAEGPLSSQRYRFDVNAETQGHPFTLTPTNSDVGIVFHGSSKTTIDSQRGSSPEVGTVPIGAKVAEVCLVSGNSTGFTYVAG